MVWDPYRFEYVRACYRDEAEYLRICLDLDLVSGGEVIAWADELVAALPQPPVEMIDLSLQTGEPAHALATAIASVSRGANTDAVARQVLGLLKRRFARGDATAEVARLLFRLADFLDVPERLRNVLRMSHWVLEDAAHGYGDAYQVRERIAQLFEEHAAVDRIGPGLGLIP